MKFISYMLQVCEMVTNWYPNFEITGIEYPILWNCQSQLTVSFSIRFLDGLSIINQQGLNEYWLKLLTNM